MVSVKHKFVDPIPDEAFPGVKPSNWNDEHFVDLATLPLIIGNRMAILGTSLVQQNNLGTSSPKQSYWSRGWMTWARFYSRGRFSCPVYYDSTVVPGWEPSGVPGATRYFQGLNFGVSGQLAADIEARLPYINANYANKFDIIVVDAGTNDMLSSLQTKEQVQATRERICNYLLAMGKIVILLPILARGLASWPSGSDARKKANWINNKSRQYVYPIQNLYLFDWNSAWVNGNNVDGIPLPNYVDVDDIHFSQPGAEPVGFELAQYLSTILPDPQDLWFSPDDKYDATINTYGNLFTNPALTGTAGPLSTAVTGVFASNWRMTRSSGTACTVVGSKELRSDNRGENQVCTFTLSGTTEETFFFAPQTADTTHTLAGKFIGAAFEIETNNSDGITGVTLYHRDQNGTGAIVSYDMEPYDGGSGNVFWAARTRIGLLNSTVIMANDSTTVRTRIEIKVKGGGTVNPIVKIGCPVQRWVPSPITNSY